MPDLRPTPSVALARVSQRIRTRGLAEVAATGAQRLRAAVWSRDRLVFLVHPTGGTPRPAPPGFEFREATASDGARYAAQIGTDSPSTFARRLTEATTCWLVIGHGEIAHASWTTTARAWTREVARYFQPPGSDGYIYESFMSPEVRGRGIYPFALEEILDRMGRRGAARMWVGVEAHNEPSVKAISKAGFEQAFEIDYGRRLFRPWLGKPTGPLADPGLFPRH